MKQDFLTKVFRNWLLVILTAVFCPIQLLIACGRVPQECIEYNCGYYDATAAPQHKGNTPKPDATSPDNNQNSDDNADNANNRNPIQLACANEPNPNVNHITLSNTNSAQPLPLAIWEQQVKACNAFRIQRDNGYEYHLTMIPTNRGNKVQFWVQYSTIGNNTPPHEIINVTQDSQAYLYTSTDLGVPKIYALYVHSQMVLYVEWIYDSASNPDERLRNLNENHMTLEIPNDLRELLAELN